MEDLYILSDLHLGEGRAADTLRYSRLEAFFYDQEFANFVERVLVEAMATRTAARLVLNGDVFDFLAVSRLPSNEELRRERMRLSRSEHKFGLATTAPKSAWKMSRIVAGHPTFFRALLRFVRAGMRVTILRGNHDVELFWDEVRDRFYREVAALADEDGEPVSEATLRESMAFESWFYHEPGRVYVEHGHQYEASNSFRFLLNPVLPARYSDTGAALLDLPAGSLFVRHIYNKIKLVDPYATYYVSLDQYLGLVGSANLLDMVRTLTLHLPFFVRVVREARLFELHGMEEVGSAHRERVRTEAARKGLPHEKVEQIDALTVEPLGKTKYSLVQEMLRPMARTALSVLGVGLLVVLGWFLVFTLIQSTGLIAEGIIGKAGLLALFAVTSFVGLFFGLVWLHQRMRGSALVDPMTDLCFEKAETIAELLDVPYVAMGHTHKPDMRPFTRRNGAFANSGTWILNKGDWDAIKPKSRQFTFVRLTGMSMDVLRWDDAGRRWEPVPILEDYRPSTLERLFRDDARRR